MKIKGKVLVCSKCSGKAVYLVRKGVGIWYSCDRHVDELAGGGCFSVSPIDSFGRVTGLATWIDFTGEKKARWDLWKQEAESPMGIPRCEPKEHAEGVERFNALCFPRQEENEMKDYGSAIVEGDVVYHKLGWLPWSGIVVKIDSEPVGSSDSPQKIKVEWGGPAIPESTDEYLVCLTTKRPRLFAAVFALFWKSSVLFTSAYTTFKVLEFLYS